MRIKALIVDDEPLAQNIIEQYSRKLPNLSIAGKCNDAICAHQFLQENKIDLLFLDINMPKISGITFLKNLNPSPLVIITTAYSEYALDGYELNAIDYLKKPFSFERFCKAFFKAEKLLMLKERAQKKENITLKNINYLFIKADKKNYKINFSDIYFIEGLGDYIQIYLKDKKIITNISMKKMMSSLPYPNFIRIHKSYIISMDKLELIEGNSVIINKKRIPIGNSYRQSFMEYINNFS